jgi:hypothetical protein
MIDETFVTIKHLAQAEFCRRGGRRLVKLHRIDWDEVIKNGGIPLSRIEHIDDVFIQRVVEVVKNGK